MSDRLLLEIALKSTVILIAAWVSARWMSSAGMRHLTWAVSLMAVLLVPILVTVGPTWYTPVTIDVNQGFVDSLVARASPLPKLSRGVQRSPSATTASGTVADTDALFPQTALPAEPRAAVS